MHLAFILQKASLFNKNVYKWTYRGRFFLSQNVWRWTYDRKDLQWTLQSPWIILIFVTSCSELNPYLHHQVINVDVIMITNLKCFQNVRPKKSCKNWNSSLITSCFRLQSEIHSNLCFCLAGDFSCSMMCSAFIWCNMIRPQMKLTPASSRPSHQCFLPSWFKFSRMLFCYNASSHEAIVTDFCTCHDSIAVMACAQFSSDLLSRNAITAK